MLSLLARDCRWDEVKDLFFFFLHLFSSFFWSRRTWDLSFPSRDRTRAPCIGSAESYLLDRREVQVKDLEMEDDPGLSGGPVSSPESFQEGGERVRVREERPTEAEVRAMCSCSEDGGGATSRGCGASRSWKRRRTDSSLAPPGGSISPAHTLIRAQ